jgi:hypothetical protein
MQRGSVITAEVSLRRLGKAYELLNNTTPREMVVKVKKSKKQFQNQLEDLVSKMERGGKDILSDSATKLFNLVFGEMLSPHVCQYSAVSISFGYGLVYC